MSDSLGTYFFFGNAEYIWGIAVNSVFALLVWIFPSLRKRAQAGRECRLAGMDSPYTGMRKSYLSGMTHLPKARHIPGAAPPETGQLQPPLPSLCLRSQAGCSSIWRGCSMSFYDGSYGGGLRGKRWVLTPGPVRSAGPRALCRQAALLPRHIHREGPRCRQDRPSPGRSGPSPAGPGHLRSRPRHSRSDRGRIGPFTATTGPSRFRTGRSPTRTSPSPGRLGPSSVPAPLRSQPGAGSPAPERCGAGGLPGLRRAEGGGVVSVGRGHGGDELARGRAQEDSQSAGAGGRR